MRAVWNGPLWAHALALAGLLSALGAFIGTRSTFSADEANIILQAQAIQHGHWFLPDPLPSVDRGALAPPVLNAYLSRLGLVLLPNHLYYTAVIAVLLWAGGAAGVMALSVVGTAAAASCSAAVARWVAPGLERWAFWATGLASPLFLYGVVDTGQAIGAGLVAGSSLCFLAYLRGGRWRWLLASAVLIALGAMAREEATLWCVAMAAGAVGVSLLSPAELPRRRALTAAAAVGTLGLGVRGIDLLSSRSIVDSVLSHSVAASTTIRDGGIGPATLRGAAIAVFAPGSVGDPWSLAQSRIFFISFAVLFVGAATMVALRRRESFPVVLGGAITTALLVVARLVLSPTLAVSGLMAAFPVLWLGLWALGRPAVTGVVGRWIALTSTLFAAATLAAIYPDGGGLQWGGRYLLLSVPLLVPVVLGALRSRVSYLDPRQVGALAVCLVVASLACTWQMGAVLTANHRDEAVLASEVSAAAGLAPPGDGGPPVALSDAFALGDLWTLYPRFRFLYPSFDQLAMVAARMRAAGIQKAILVTQAPYYDNLLVGKSYVVSARLAPSPALPGWYVEILSRR